LRKYAIDPHNNSSASRLARQGHWWGSAEKQRKDARRFVGEAVIRDEAQRPFNSSSVPDSSAPPASYRGKKRDPRDFW